MSYKKVIFCKKCNIFHEVDNATICPICGATDKNIIVSNKHPHELGYTHFLTPAEVRQMTAEEVKNNYAWIITSMSRAH